MAKQKPDEEKNQIEAAPIEDPETQAAPIEVAESAPAPLEQAPAESPAVLPETGKDSASNAFHASLEGTQEIKRGRGRPRKDGSAPVSEIKKDEILPKKDKVDITKERKEKCRISGEVSAKMILGTMAAFGPEYTLSMEKPNEAQAVTMAISSTGEFFEYMNWADLPPVVGLCVSWGMVAIAIANKPENAPKVNAMKERIKAWIQTRKADKASRG